MEVWLKMQWGKVSSLGSFTGLHDFMVSLEIPSIPVCSILYDARLCKYIVIFVSKCHTGGVIIRLDLRSVVPSSGALLAYNIIYRNSHDQLHFTYLF